MCRVIYYIVNYILCVRNKQKQTLMSFSVALLGAFLACRANGLQRAVALVYHLEREAEKNTRKRQI